MRVVSLLFLVTLVGSAVAADKTNFAKRVPASLTGRVQIANVEGSVMVTAWNRPEVDVTGTLGEDVERVDVSSANGVTIVNVVLPNTWARNGDARLEVHIPADSAVDVSTVSASIKVVGVQGTAHLQSVSGNVEAQSMGSILDAKSVSGGLALQGSGKAGQVRVSTVSGQISLGHVAGELEANSTSGNLNISLDSARVARVRTISGNLSFQGRLLRDARLEAESVSGALAVQAPAEGGYQYDVSTFSGAIQNCFGEEATRTSPYAPGSHLGGTRAAGQGNVRLKTLSGAISLCDR